MELSFDPTLNSFIVKARRQGATLTMLDKNRELLVQDAIALEMEAAKTA